MNVNTFVIIGFVVTWAIAILGFGVQWGTTRAENRWIKEWIKGHETYSQQRDHEMVILRETLATLKVLSEQGSQRLKFIEDVVLATMKGGA